MLELKHDIQKKVKTDIDRQQREFMLHQQMKTIQDELGGSPVDQEIKVLRERASGKNGAKRQAAILRRRLRS